MNRQTEIWNSIGPLLLKRYKRTATFLDHQNTWQLLIAVIMSAQMTDDGVNKVTPALFKKYPHPSDLSKASIASIVKIIKPINYHNAKARYIKQTAQIIVKTFNGNVPDNEADLLTLPGVGRKTAVAVLANGFGKHIGIPVDTHVIRFAHRFKLSRHRDPSKIEQDLLKIIPKKDWNRAGYAIKEYGRKEGKARGYHPEHDPLWQTFKTLA
jgi:endonuclease-3